MYAVFPYLLYTNRVYKKGGSCLLGNSPFQSIWGGSGGEGGIRTREKLTPLRDFQSRPFVHSGTSPREDDTLNYRFASIQPQVWPDHI